MGITVKKDSVVRFLKAVRRRVWLENVLSRMRVAVWVGSGVLLALAMISALLTPISFAWATGAALLAAVLVALPELLHRPTLVECAVRADGQFGGQSLLTTALDAQRGKISETPSCAVVLAQAKEAVAVWWPRINSVWRTPSPTTFALATVPAFVALLLLIVSSPQAVTESAAQYQAGGRGEPVGDTDNSVVDLRDSIHRSASDERSERTTPEADQAVSTDLAVVAAANTELNENSVGTPFATTAPGVGSDAGNAHRTPDLPDSPATQAAGELPLFADRTEQKILRRGELSAGVQAGDTDYAQTSFARPISRGQRRPAAAAPTVSPWTVMTAAEVAYARLYLNERFPSDEVSSRD